MEYRYARGAPLTTSAVTTSRAGASGTIPALDSVVAGVFVASLNNLVDVEKDLLATGRARERKD